MERVTTNAKCLGEGKIGSVRSGLIPALHSSTNRAHNDRQEQHAWHLPFVQNLVAEGFDFRLVEFLIAREIFVSRGVLRYQGAFADDFSVIRQVLLSAKFIDLGEEAPSGDANEGVFYSRLEQVRQTGTLYFANYRGAVVYLELGCTHLASTLALRFTFTVSREPKLCENDGNEPLELKRVSVIVSSSPFPSLVFCLSSLLSSDTVLDFLSIAADKDGSVCDIAVSGTRDMRGAWRDTYSSM